VARAGTLLPIHQPMHSTDLRSIYQTENEVETLEAYLRIDDFRYGVRPAIRPAVVIAILAQCGRKRRDGGGHARPCRGRITWIRQCHDSDTEWMR
jgi:hypothetical protein